MVDINELEQYFSDDENELKKIIKEMGVDLDDLEKSFENFNPKRSLKYEVISEDAVEPIYNYPLIQGLICTQPKKL